MKRLPLLLATTLTVALASGAQGQTAPATAPRIGYINSQKILAEAPGAKEAQAQFEQDMQSYRAEVQKMATEVEAMVKQYEQQQLTLSPEAKQRREAEIRTRQQTYQTRVQELDEVAGRRQQELVQPVMDQITKVIEDLRAQGSYALIFDVSAGSIISADPTLDLTDEVIRRLAGPRPPARQR